MLTIPTIFNQVAFLVDAWIETNEDQPDCDMTFTSRSSWTRGLKLTVLDLRHRKVIVAFLVDAWIETSECHRSS